MLFGCRCCSLLFGKDLESLFLFLCWFFLAFEALEKPDLVRVIVVGCVLSEELLFCIDSLGRLFCWWKLRPAGFSTSCPLGLFNVPVRTLNFGF